MNVTQFASLARILIIFVGGFAVAKGLVSQEMIDRASDLTTITQVVGGLAAAGAAIYAVYARRPAGIVASAADVPGVEKITADPKLANAVPSPKVQAR